MMKNVHINNPKPLLKAIEFRVDAAHSRGASELMDILEAVVAGKVRETAIEREVGDSVLYHSLAGFPPPTAFFWGRSLV
jgi:hypothetical protein